MIQTLPRHLLEDYILSYSSEEQRQARALWRDYTARKELIDFKHYDFNPKTLRYTDTRRKRLIHEHQIAVDVLRFANGMRTQLRTITAQAVNGRMDSQDWYDEMRRSMKLSYRATVDVASGGEDVNQNQKNALMTLLLLYFLRLNRFADGINSNQIPFTAAILARSGLYGLSNKSVFENWRFHLAVAQGFTECRRVPGPSEHCENSATRPGCDELIRRGWMPMSLMPPIGQTTCLGNCQCQLEFRGIDPFLAAAVSSNSQKAESFMHVYDHDGRLLFKYAPSSAQIEIKHKWHTAPVLIDLKNYQ